MVKQYQWRVLRDLRTRQGFAETEIHRRGFLYVARNQALPAEVRHQAQMQLNRFTRYTQPTKIKNRCHETGRGRGVMSEWGLCRQQFRLRALNGELNGVRKASW